LGPAGPAYPICTEGDIRSQFVITNYSAEIETENFAEDSFLIKRQITYKEVEQTCVYRDWESKTIRESITEDLPGETIQGSRVGLFLHEVELPTKLNNYSCCPDTASVAVTNLPYHSFFDAQYARDLNVDEYLGKETITWEGNYPERGIRFAYIPSPFHNVHSLLTPFIELSKFDNWALALLGFTVSSLFVAVVKSSVVDWMKGKFKELFKKEKDTKKDDQPK
jgi:hypothetical protein